MIISSQKEELTILHFIGVGRSGSTLLNIMLDNHPSVTGTGELSFFARSWLSGDYCSCGQRLNSCSFWVKVRNEWIERTGMESLEEYVKLQAMFERYRKVPQIYFELRSPSQQFQQYCNYTLQLFKVIQELTGVRVISDSSKNPARVLSLTAIPEIDLRVVFLVRDARGYAWSQLKSFKKNRKAGLGKSTGSISVWKSTIQWLVINLISERVLRKANNHIRLCYEDLIRDPYEVLSNIGELIDTDLSSLSQLLKREEELEVKHISAGNRLRMKTKIRLENKETWQTQMSASKKAISWVLAGWLLKKYGY